MEIPLEDFFKAYYDCRKHKRGTFNALQFETNYEENLVKLYEEVNRKTYEIGKSICFLVTRPKLREVFAADFRDRIIHHLIMQRLEPLFEANFIQDTYNCRKEKGVLYGVKRVYQMIKECSNNYTKDCYIGKFDMQGFFMTIDKTILLKKLYNFINKYYRGDDIDLLIYLIDKVVSNKPQNNCIVKGDIKQWKLLPKNKSLFTCNQNCGLPIGNLTSQIFANFYLSEFDDYMKSLCKYYGRYVDDFIIIGDKKVITGNVKNIKQQLGSVNIVLHPDKIYIQHYTKGVNFIGFVIKKNRLYVANRTVSNMYMAISRYNDNQEEDAVHVLQSLNSYLGFLKHYMTFAIKCKMYLRISSYWLSKMKISKDFQKFILL